MNHRVTNANVITNQAGFFTSVLQYRHTNTTQKIIESLLLRPKETGLAIRKLWAGWLCYAIEAFFFC
jgi:hypothetical protein